MDSTAPATSPVPVAKAVVENANTIIKTRTIATNNFLFLQIDFIKTFFLLISVLGGNMPIIPKVATDG